MSTDKPFFIENKGSRLSNIWLLLVVESEVKSPASVICVIIGIIRHIDERFRRFLTCKCTDEYQEGIKRPPRAVL
jgi:hypothetical protein